MLWPRLACVSLVLAIPFALGVASARAQASDENAFYVRDARTLEACGRQVAPLAAAIRAVRGARASRQPPARIETLERAVARVASAVGACRRRASIDPPLGMDVTHRTPQAPPHHRLAGAFLESVARTEGADVDVEVVRHALLGSLSSACQFRLGDDPLREGPPPPSGGAVTLSFSLGASGLPTEVATEVADEAAQRVVPCAEAWLADALLPALRRGARFRVVLVFPPFGATAPPRGGGSTATVSGVETSVPVADEARVDNERTLRFASDELAACHARAAPPAPAGTVRFDFQVGASGMVASPDLVEDGLRRPDLHACLLAGLRRERFAPLAPNGYQLRFAIELGPRP